MKEIFENNKIDSSSVIINILEGINELKNEVRDLKIELDQLVLNPKVSNCNAKSNESKTRTSTPSLKKSTALQLITEILAKNDLKVQVAKRAEGSGLFIINPQNGKRLHALLRNSGDYRSIDFKFNSFISLNEKDVDNFDIMIFSVFDRNKEVHWFIFTKQQFKQLLKQKKKQSNGMVSLYLDQNNDGEYVDGREKNPIDIDYAVNQWSIIVDLIKTKFSKEEK